MALVSNVIRSRTIGFLGIGRMGWEMSRNLFLKQQPGTEFVVCDANEQAVISFLAMIKSALPEARITAAATPAEVAVASQVVVTMLPSSPQVQEVYLGRSGVLSALTALPPGHDTLCIDSTTLDIEIARDVASAVTDTGTVMVDAPVSGGVAGAQAATLSFLVGGTEDAFRRSEPIMRAMGSRLFHCGSSGAGLAAKLCNNSILGIQSIAVAEAMLLGEELGLEPAVLASVINSSTGANWCSSINNPVPGALEGKSPPCERDFEGGFAAALMLKDMTLAMQAAENAHSPFPLGSAATYLYEQVVSHDTGRLAKKDFSVVYKYLREMSAE